MNKKYLNYSVLMLLLTSINPSFTMDDKDKNTGFSLWHVGIAAAAAIYIAYPILPISGSKWEDEYENVSSTTQEWAKNVLLECGIKDANKILLKTEKHGRINEDENSWGALGSHFIIIPNDFDPLTCSPQECLEGKYILKHEVKHLQNYDAVKERALLVGTVALGFWLTQEKLPLMILIMPVGYGVNMAYWKYHESEADRFAYERATSRQELEASKNYFLKGRQSTKDSIFNGMPECDWEEVEKQLEEKKNELFYGDYFTVKSVFFLYKKIKSDPDMAIDVAEFISDHEHPSSKSRAAMAQDYINKWDEKYKKQSNIFGMNRKA